MSDSERNSVNEDFGSSALLSGFTAWVEVDENRNRKHEDAYCKEMWFPCLPAVGTVIFAEDNVWGIGSMEVSRICFWEYVGKYVITVDFDEDVPLDECGWKVGCCIEHW